MRMRPFNLYSLLVSLLQGDSVSSSQLDKSSLRGTTCVQDSSLERISCGIQRARCDARLHGRMRHERTKVYGREEGKVLGVEGRERDTKLARGDGVRLGLSYGTFGESVDLVVVAKNGFEVGGSRATTRLFAKSVTSFG